jgi:hypothetical protein
VLVLHNPNAQPAKQPTANASKAHIEINAIDQNPAKLSKQTVNQNSTNTC